MSTSKNDPDDDSADQSPADQATDEFAAMFEASLKPKRFEKGQTIEGRIVGLGQDVAFIDVGGKGEATIDLAELKDDDGDVEVEVGDRIQAVVVSTIGGLTLSRRLARGTATARQLEDAFHSGLPVEGKVEQEVKGGYEVRIAGQRAFCPFSQIDVRRIEGATYIGQVHQFRIIEYKDGGKSIVVSRRALVEEEQRAQAVELRRSIVPGAVLTGRVASLQKFGAFVDLGAGVQGLLHVSEMGWSRVADPGQIVQPGDEITVRVLRVDDNAQRISLGLKQLTADPWSTVSTKYEVGQVVTGRVTRIADFGAFVELEPGIEALAHVSTFAPSGKTRRWSADVTPGMTAPFEILTIDLDKKRLGVALVPEGSSRARGFESTIDDDTRDTEAATPDTRADAARAAAASSAQKPAAPPTHTAPPTQPAPSTSTEKFGSSLADKLRGALSPRQK